MYLGVDGKSKLEVGTKLKECGEKVVSITKHRETLYCGLENGYMYMYEHSW